jgi:hypothetical protein
MLYKLCLPSFSLLFHFSVSYAGPPNIPINPLVNKAQPSQVQPQTSVFGTIAQHLASGRIGGLESVPASSLARGLQVPLFEVNQVLEQSKMPGFEQRVTQTLFQQIFAPSSINGQSFWQTMTANDKFLMGYMLAQGLTDPGDLTRILAYLRNNTGGDLVVDNTADRLELLILATRGLDPEARRSLMQHLASWNQAAAQALATGRSDAFNRLIDNALTRSGTDIMANQPVFSGGLPSSPRHMPLLQKAPEPFVQSMAEAMLRLARYIHEEGFKAIVLSDGAADELARPLLEAAWERLYGKEIMPPLYLFASAAMRYGHPEP